MGIDVSHLVLEALGDTDNQVVDEGADGSESGDILTDAVVNLDVDDVLLGLREVNSDVGEVLGELSSGALDGDKSGLDVDLDCWTKTRSAMIPMIPFPCEFCQNISPKPRIQAAAASWYCTSRRGSGVFHLLLAELTTGRVASNRTSFRNLQGLLRMNVLHLVGIFVRRCWGGY